MSITWLSTLQTLNNLLKFWFWIVFLFYLAMSSSNPTDEIRNSCVFLRHEFRASPIVLICFWFAHLRVDRNPTWRYDFSVRDLHRFADFKYDISSYFISVYNQSLSKWLLSLLHAVAFSVVSLDSNILVLSLWIVSCSLQLSKCRYAYYYEFFRLYQLHELDVTVGKLLSNVGLFKE